MLVRVASAGQYVTSIKVYSSLQNRAAIQVTKLIIQSSSFQCLWWLLKSATMEERETEKVIVGNTALHPKFLSGLAVIIWVH